MARRIVVGLTPQAPPWREVADAVIALVPGRIHRDEVLRTVLVLQPRAEVEAATLARLAALPGVAYAQHESGYSILG